MADVFSRRNALLGWLVWKVAKRRLLGQLSPERAPRRIRLGLVALAAAVPVALAAWMRRRRST